MTDTDPAPPPALPDPHRETLIRADIADVARQLEAGELDEETARRLTARYQAELDSLTDASPPPPEKRPGLSRRRAAVGTLLLAGLFASAAAGAWLAVGSGDRIGDGGAAGEQVDLARVTNEQMEAVIAANPDLPQIAGMRLALADRYFDDGEFSAALPHYLGALDGELDSVRRARSLARVGWMSHVSGAPEAALRYLEEALAADPAYEEARLFLGLALLDGDDPAGALRQLEPLLAGGALPEELRPMVEGAADAARDRLEEGR